MIWTAAPGVALHRIPDGCGDLVWCNGALYVWGPRITPHSISPTAAASLVGFRFVPGAAAKWLGTAASDIVDVCAPLDDFGKQRAERLCDAVKDVCEPHAVASRLETALADTICSQTSLDRSCLNKVLELLERDHGRGGFLDALQHAYGCSERSARRQTIGVFGYAPKMLERIWRVRHFLHHARSQRQPSLAWVASAVGFSDQAHMTRELNSIAGITPAQLLKLDNDAEGFAGETLIVRRATFPDKNSDCRHHYDEPKLPFGRRGLQSRRT